MLLDLVFSRSAQNLEDILNIYQRDEYCHTKCWPSTPKYKQKKHRARVRRLPQLVALLNDNPALGLFATALPCGIPDREVAQGV
jgi:hypothetical protein